MPHHQTPESRASSGGPSFPASRASRLAARLQAAVEDFRAHLAHADALVGLSLLAVAAGLITGVVIIAFRVITERSLVWVGLIPAIERYETLTWAWRLGLPTAGGLLIGLLFQWAPVAARQVGPAHVMAQLASNAGRLPWPNAVLQFVGGAMSIVAGHSVGREGPVIHVGAASASLLGQWMRLPNNSIRTLVACGVAASIAASFNTPIAGVVFAMEVVMLEYTLTGFAPVILAAVSATALSRLVYGPDPAFSVPGFQLVSLLELPWIVLLGLVIGCLGAAYVYGIRTLDQRFRDVPLWLRTTAAGAFTGLCALAAPEVMGLGYDTVQLAMLGEIGLAALVLIALLKLAATVACGGLGVPGGVIGPMVVMGATAGGALGVIGHALVPALSSHPAFYAMLGVAAMMGASLHAPLAALMAMLELTGNPNTILPGMVAVIIAFLMARVVCRQGPIFVSILQSRGMDYRFDPLALVRGHTGVRAVMNRRFVIVERDTTSQELAQRLSDLPDWVVVADGERIRAVLTREALATPDDPVQGAAVAWPAASPPFAVVPAHVTLGEALALLDNADADVALVVGATPVQRRHIHGVVSRWQIESGGGERP